MTQAAAGRPDRIVVHVGLPKAASSALQFWCDAHRGALAAHGVDYPPSPAHDAMARHSWLVPEAMKGHAPTLAATRAACGLPTLMLSHEGLSAQHARIPAAGWAALREGLAGVPLRLLVMSRDADGWLRSLWGQGIINPVPAGQRPMTLDLDGFAQVPGVRAMLDARGFGDRMADRLGAADIVHARVEDDWLATLLAALGTPGLAATTGRPVRAHPAAPDAALALMLAANRLDGPADPDRRLALLAAIKAETGSANLMLGNVHRRVAASPDARRAALAAVLGDALARIDPADAPQRDLHDRLRARALRGAAAFAP